MARLTISTLCFLVAVLSSQVAVAAQEACEAGSDGVCKQESILTIGTVRTVDEDIEAMCPTTRFTGAAVVGSVLSLLSWLVKAGDTITSKTFGKELLTPGWADDYTTAVYNLVGQLTMRIFHSRSKDDVNVPTAMASNESVKAGSIYVPHYDEDGYPNFLWLEKLWFTPTFLIKHFYVPALTCSYAGMRWAEFNDTLTDPNYNTWEILKHSSYSNKKAWLLSFYDNLHTWSNDPTWPPQRMDFTAMFRNGDLWDDGVESAIAFDAIGTHRVEVGSFEKDGHVFPFAIRLNNFSTIEVRPHFGKYGGDLYFTAEGLPAVLETTDGRLVKRGDKDWQYWKFVWRSSLVTLVTLLDHLHLTHFKSAGFLARATRMGLPAYHPIRRFLSIFTFGSIFVNLQAQFTLVGSGGMLNRATAFKDFASVSERIVPRMLPDISEAPGMQAVQFGHEFEKLPRKLQEAPFYADGRDVFKALHKLAKNVSKASHLCENTVKDREFLHFQQVVAQENTEAHYQTKFWDVIRPYRARQLKGEALNATETEVLCETLSRRMALYMFMVTAWHSHVGFVGDYYADADFVGMSWKEGEAFARPRQAVITSIINVFTSTKQPRLMEDFTHLFQDILGGAKLTQIWKEFVADLRMLKQKIDERNANRKIPNINMDPEILECSVAK